VYSLELVRRRRRRRRKSSKGGGGAYSSFATKRYIFANEALLAGRTAAVFSLLSLGSNVMFGADLMIMMRSGASAEGFFSKESFFSLATTLSLQ